MGVDHLVSFHMAERHSQHATICTHIIFHNFFYSLSKNLILDSVTPVIFALKYRPKWNKNVLSRSQNVHTDEIEYTLLRKKIWTISNGWMNARNGAKVDLTVGSSWQTFLHSMNAINALKSTYCSKGKMCIDNRSKSNENYKTFGGGRLRSCIYQMAVGLFNTKKSVLTKWFFLLTIKGFTPHKLQTLMRWCLFIVQFSFFSLASFFRENISDDSRLKVDK